MITESATNFELVTALDRLSLLAVRTIRAERALEGLDSTRACFERGMAQSANKRYDEAVQSFNEVLSNETANEFFRANATFQLAMIHSQQGRYAEAEPLLLQAKDHRNVSPEDQAIAQFEVGTIYKNNQEKEDTALSLFNQIKDNQNISYSFRMHAHLEFLLLQMEIYGYNTFGTKEFCERLKEDENINAQDRARARLAFGIFLMNGSERLRRDEGIAYFTQVMNDENAAPADRAEARLHLGAHHHFPRVEYDEASTLFNSVIDDPLARDIDKNGARAQLGVIHHIQNRFDQALPLFEQVVVKGDPQCFATRRSSVFLRKTRWIDLVMASFHLGNLYNRRRRHQEAISILQPAVENENNFSSTLLANACITLGFAYQRLKKYGDAKKAYSKVSRNPYVNSDLRVSAISYIDDLPLCTIL
jgi:tetratricopeptide (TPR) repeat protein